MTNFEIVDEIQRSLEKEGIFQSVRAQLRANVFRIISDGPDYTPKPNKVVEFARTIEGKTTLLLVRDLLEQLNLSQSLSVFQAETGLEQISSHERSTLEQSLDISRSLADQTNASPILVHVVRSHLHGHGNHNDSTLSQHHKHSSHSADAKHTGGHHHSNTQHSEQSRHISNNINENEGDDYDYEHIEKPQTHKSEYKSTSPTAAPKSDSVANNYNDTSFEDDDVPMSSGFEAEEGNEESGVTSTINRRDLLKHENFPLNTRSYDFNEVVEDEEILSEVEEENDYAHSDDENKDNKSQSQSHSSQLSIDNSRRDFHADAKQSDLDHSNRSSDRKLQSSTGSQDSSRDSKREGVSSSLPALSGVKKVLPPVVSTSKINSTPHANVSMDISSSFEADTSTHSITHSPQKDTISSFTSSAQSKLPSVTQNKYLDDKKDDIDDEEEIGEESGPEIDTESEGDQEDKYDHISAMEAKEDKNAASNKFRDTVDYARSSVPSGSHSDGIKRVDVRGGGNLMGNEFKDAASDDDEEEERSEVAAAKSKASVQRMGQGSVSRSRTGWGNVSDDHRPDSQSDEEGDDITDKHLHRETRDDSLRDISDDNIDPQHVHRRLPIQSASSRDSHQSPPRNVRSTGGAWGHSSTMPGRNKGPGSPSRSSPLRSNAHNISRDQEDSHLDSSFEAEESIQHDLNMSRRSNNQEEEEDEVVIEHEDSYHSDEDEHDSEQYSSRDQSKDNSQSMFTTRPGQQPKPQHSPEKKESVSDAEQDDEYAVDEYGDDFEDDENADDSRMKTNNRSPVKQQPSQSQPQSRYNHNNNVNDEEDEEEEIIEEEMSVGNNSDDDMSVGENSDASEGYKMTSKQASGSKSNAFGGNSSMSKSRSGPLPNLPVRHTAEPDHNPNSYFNNSDESESEVEDNNSSQNQISSRMSEIDKRMADMEREDATLAHLKRNIQDESAIEESGVISDSGSVASEDIDVMEFSAGHHSESEDDAF